MARGKAVAAGLGAEPVQKVVSGKGAMETEGEGNRRGAVRGEEVWGGALFFTVFLSKSEDFSFVRHF